MLHLSKLVFWQATQITSNPPSGNNIQLVNDAGDYELVNDAGDYSLWQD